MRTLNTDVAVIGAGTAGLSARRELEKAGKHSVLIEGGPHGTTCARVGCMPSKLLIAAADARQAALRASQFGIRVEAAPVDGPAVLERVRRMRDDFVSGVLRRVEGIPEDERLDGCARFVDRTSLVVGDHTRVNARAVVIATGSSPWIPPPFDAIEEHVETSDSIFEWRALPRSVAMIGTGVIALELGQALHRLGVSVAFFNPFEDLGPLTDPACQRVAREVFSRELELHLGVQDLSADVVEEGMRLRWRDDDRDGERTFERVVVAAGRRPNLASLDLAKTGLPLDDRGVPPWNRRTCQCGDAPIFMAGDVINSAPLLHEASDEGHIAGMNAACFPDVISHVRRTSLAIVFSDPQIATVGRRFSELATDETAIGEASYANQGRARVMGVNRGIVRVYAERSSCRLLGAELFAPRAEHMGHLLAWAVQQGMTVQDALSMPYYHPTLEEALRRALREAGRDLAVLSGCRGEDVPEDCPGD